MQRFLNPGFGTSNDPWFSVGTFGVDTTGLVSGLSILWFFVYAAEGPSRAISTWLVYSSTDVLRGELWRLVTWPIVNAPGWAIISILVFYYIGNQIERSLGKVRMAWFLLVLTVVPALFLTFVDLFSAIAGGEAGIDTLELGVLVAFVASMPGVKFFFGIPGWILVSVFIGLSMLGDLGVGDYYGFLFLLVITVTALLEIRAVGLAETLEWVPKLPLPASMGGDPYRSQARGQVSRKKAKKTHLQAVNPLEEQMAQIEIDHILDQVSESGLDSLSKDQRKKLENYSKQQRKKNGS